MSTELVNSGSDDMMGIVNKAAEDAKKEDGSAQTLLSLWAELEWLAINEG